MFGKKTHGFTLIELLIVVAIIGILAAIAVPNFLNAQVRAKVSHAVSDMRTISIAIAAYRLDHNFVPPWRNNLGFPEGVDTPNQIRYYRLTSPTSYLSSVPDDPFTSYMNPEDYEIWGTGYDYVETMSDVYGEKTNCWGHEYRLNSWGPDMENGWGGNRYWSGDIENGCPNGIPRFQYNPTNGLNSFGDIVWVGQKGGRSHRNPYCPIKNGY